MKNQIYYISDTQKNSLIAELKTNTANHIAIIDGQNTQTWEDYLQQVRKIYKFPTVESVFDGYRDWMQDLSWLNKETFSLFITDFNLFMCKEPINKKIVMDLFLEAILPWWEKDVELYCADGKTKPFNVYLID